MAIVTATTTTQTRVRKTDTLANGKSFIALSNEATDSETIPTIDVGRMYSPDAAHRKALASEIRQAATEIGFFTIINHGIERHLVGEAYAQAQRFFAQSLERKMEVCTDLKPEEFCGYHPMERYNWQGRPRRDFNEAFNWNYDAAFDPDMPDESIVSINLWPKDLPEFREKLQAYQSALISFARRLTRIFALALDLPEDAFDGFVERPEAGMRILHYPAQAMSRDEQNGIGSHTDVECFTIVTADSPGLEVLSKGGRWIKVQPVDGAFVVNIADCFMRQTNDVFVSTIHRVINENGKDRYAVPFFWGFNRDTLLSPLPTCVSDDNPPRYPVVTAGEYYAWRTRRQKEL